MPIPRLYDDSEGGFPTPDEGSWFSLIKPEGAIIVPFNFSPDHAIFL